MNGKNIAMLVVLASMWGASFLFMRVAAPVFGPVFTTELRVTLAAAALLVYALLSGQRPQIKLYWRQYLILGGLNAAIPFSLICMSEVHLAASFAAILNATTPLFAALTGMGLDRKPLGISKATGLLTGLAGVVILVGWSPVGISGWLLASVLFSLLAALSYALGGHYTGRVFKGVKPLDMAIGQQLGASVLLLPLAILFRPSEMPTANAVYSVVALALVCTSLAYLIFFRLMNNVGPLKTLSVTFLVPVFGVLWGALFLGEQVHLNTVIGLAVILASITLVNEIRVLKRRRGSGAPAHAGETENHS
jgi:drug/metabolite transporter (DMT)-like permease